MNFANLKIGARLRLGFGLVLLLLAGVAGVGVSSLSELNEGADTIIHTHYPKVLLAQDAMNGSNQVARAVRSMLLTNDAGMIAKEMSRIANERKNVTEIMAKLELQLITSKGAALFKTMRDKREPYTQALDQVLKLQAQGDKEAAIAYLFNTMRVAQTAYMDSLTALIDYQGELMEESGKAASDTYQDGRRLAGAITLLALALGAFLAWWVARSITRPLGEAVKVAQAVAAGDLSCHIDATGKDEVGQLLQALKDMNGSLVNIVSEVRNGTELIASASSQIATGNADLSSRTEEQASSLEETASSIEELTSTVRQNADNARQANGLAATASQVAVRGGAVVSQVVGTMGSINESAKKIVDIIGVIDGIAFQTNILALNAAVEAARAGEQGRGFAVVASEVRNLAQRSAAAAKEIKTLIGDSVLQVETGSKLVDQAGATMGEIVGSIQRVTDIMAEIAAASQEQSVGIEQVNQAISEMDQVTQQNAALVEEAAAAAESMQDQAASLVQVVSVFKLSGASAAPAPQRSAPPGPARKSGAKPLGKPVMLLHGKPCAA